MPVLRPAQRRWLDLTLVVDASPTMVVWRRTVAELRTLTELMGAFRTVRVLRLHAGTGADSPVRLYPEGDAGLRRSEAAAWGRKSTDAHSNVVASMRDAGPGGRDPASLATGFGQQAVLVVTDAVGAPWHDGRMAPVLRGWGAGAPLAVVTVLPQRMWAGAGLRAVPADLHASTPGAANAALDVRLRTRAGYPREQAVIDVPVPVLELSERWLARWADVVAGAPGRHNAALLVPEPVAGAASTPRRSSASASAGAAASGQIGTLGPVDPAAVVRRFRAAASPTAFRLACCLSAAWLNLPVMRLVQRVMLPESDTSHLAEVYLGGLLTVSEPVVGTDPEQVPYDFLPGVRAELNQYLTRRDLVDILKRTSAFVSERFGQPMDFPALLADPDHAALPVRSGGGPPLAYVAASVLAQLGGRHRALADRLHGDTTGAVALGPETAGAESADAGFGGAGSAAGESAAGRRAKRPLEVEQRDTASGPDRRELVTPPATPAHGDSGSRAAEPDPADADVPGMTADSVPHGSSHDAPADAPDADESICVVFEVPLHSRSAQEPSTPRPRPSEHLVRELLVETMRTERIDGAITVQPGHRSGPHDLVVALGPAQNAVPDAARLLLSLSRALRDSNLRASQSVPLPLAVAVTSGGLRESHAGFSGKPLVEARELLSGISTALGDTSRTSPPERDQRSTFELEVIVSPAILAALSKRSAPAVVTSRRHTPPVTAGGTRTVGHLLTHPRAVLESVASPAPAADTAMPAPRVFLHGDTNAAAHDHAQDLRRLLTTRGIAVADRPDRASAPDWADRLESQLRVCDRILVLVPARHGRTGAGQNTPSPHVEERLVRATAQRSPDRVLGVVLPGGTEADLPGYLSARRSVTLDELTPRGLTPLLDQLFQPEPGEPSPGPLHAAEPAEPHRTASGKTTPDTAAQAVPRTSPLPLRTDADHDDVRPGEGQHLGTFPPEESRHLSLAETSNLTTAGRQFTRETLRDWGWLPTTTAEGTAAAEDALLVVSELMTNAARHAGGPTALRLHLGPASLRIEVEDHSTAQPSPRSPDPTEGTGGHGLFIVQRLCTDWGFYLTPGGPGKTVWAEVAAPAIQSDAARTG
ncbi:SAV_2336 N-terminal domain-related protein [Streptomyces sp. EWL5.16]|uniref:SAV_2336 N-terminal domain-related protein n=1 Tax=Streptomyces sp. EWL5.16 TaxID=3461011 RepID=UPI0040431F02